MSSGLNTTLAQLAKTKNDAALAVLFPSLDSAEPIIQCGALGALLDRRSPKGQKEVLRRLTSLDEDQLAVIEQRRGKLSIALRDALLGDDETQFANACDAILRFREYDLVSVLVTAAEDASNPHRQLAAATLRSLCELLFGEVTAPRDYEERRDPQMVRRHVLTTLEQAVGRFGKHQCGEIIESFLMLAGRDNVVLKRLLENPYGDAYLCVVDLLRRSEEPGILRLLLGYLQDPGAPSASIGVIAHRNDLKFLKRLTQTIGDDPSSAARANLRKIESIQWFETDLELLDELDEPEQIGAVQFAVYSSVRRSQAFIVIQHLLRHGKPEGRRAAARAMPKFSGAEANQLALSALQDADPHVQAIIARQLRERGIPGAVTHLIELADSPHGVVRQAVRESLAEFTFPRFFANFETLDDAAQAGTAALVKRIDTNSAKLLAEQLQAKSRTKRMRALKITTLMELAIAVEPLVIDLLADSDFMIRAAAATTLEDCDSDAAVIALREALLDDSVAVQEAAECSLSRIVDHRERNTATAGREPA